MRFEKALKISIENLQSFGRLYFTPKQLFYESCRQLSSPMGIKAKTAVSFFGLGAVPTMFLPKNKLKLILLGGLILSGLAFSRKAPHTLAPPISFADFEYLLANYLQTNEIEGLLKIENEVSFVNKLPADLTLFGLPKVLICESDEIAQMLRANQFHLQTPCPVFSLNEAKPLNKNVKMMLKKAEEPQVFFLHNASLEAFSILKNLRETLDLSESIPLRHLGLRPVHARRLHLFAQKNVPREFDVSTFEFLDESEKKWLLRGNSAEVSAVSPFRLLRVLRRLILGFEIPPSEWQIALPQKNLGFM
jgi:hypothetical protein